MPAPAAAVLTLHSPARRQVRRAGWASLVALLPLVLLGIAPVQGQAPDPPDDLWRSPDWVGHVTFLGANVLLGGLTGGLIQEVRGGSFQDGFARGALGGAVSYGGRRLAVEESRGAGLLGRQVSAAGASMVRNASLGRPALSRLLFAVGPLSLHVQRGEEPHVQPKLDLHSSFWLVAALLDDRLELDPRASLSSGAAVFVAPRHRLSSAAGHTSGAAYGSVIVLSPDAAAMGGRMLRHERVHVLQHDWAREVWSVPVEGWLGSRVPGGRAALRFLEPAFAHAAVLGAAVTLLDIDWAHRPWEIEAGYLDRR